MCPGGEINLDEREESVDGEVEEAEESGPKGANLSLHSLSSNTPSHQTTHYTSSPRIMYGCEWAGDTGGGGRSGERVCGRGEGQEQQRGYREWQVENDELPTKHHIFLHEGSHEDLCGWTGGDGWPSEWSEGGG